ncbi:MAG: MBL fold metallo-hydrolase [Methylobacteriaceae bacterium]|nr:MBL fold metallo-hydrolase [Methylobacteriaceae bacterium]
MDLNRRTVLAGAAATLAAAPALAKAPLAGAQSASAYRYKIGDYEVTAIHDGFFSRPLEGFIKNADLADVKKAMEEAFLPTDRIPISFTTLVVNTGSKLVLIDTGNGDSGAPTSGVWMKNFKAAGFDPKDVDQVVISHFHGDHINGLRLKDGSAVFANAEIAVPAPEWAFWMDDAKMAAAPDGLKPAFQNARRVFGPIAKDVKQFEWGKEAAPGIVAVEAAGHTPGHTAFAIQSGPGRMMAMSDTTNHPALFVRNPTWAAVFDMDGDKAAATRRKLLDMAASEKTQVGFYHAPFPATGFIAKDGAGFRMQPAQWSLAL